MNDDADELRQIFREIELAMTDPAGAAEVFARHTGQDYIFTGPTGVVSNRVEILNGLKTGHVMFTAYSMSDLEVRLFEHYAVVVGRAEGDGVNPGGELFRGAYRFTSVWDHSNGPWQLVAWQTTAIGDPRDDRTA